MKGILFFFLGLSIGFTQSKTSLPKGFVYVEDVIPTIKEELRYFSSNNFVGIPIDGYCKDRSILSEKATLALNKVQKELLVKRYAIKIYDAYRPQQAVDHFVKWASRLNDTLKKAEYYPNVKKKDLFKEGYISSHSGHTKGSTLDITLIYLKTGKELDMGSPYDFFGEESWVNYQNITKAQRQNRLLLKAVMNKYGFKSYSKEWWHFTLVNEPFPDTYFNFLVD